MGVCMIVLSPGASLPAPLPTIAAATTHDHSHRDHHRHRIKGLRTYNISVGLAQVVVLGLDHFAGTAPG